MVEGGQRSQPRPLWRSGEARSIIVWSAIVDKYSGCRRMLPGRIDRYSGWLGAEGLRGLLGSRTFAGAPELVWCISIRPAMARAVGGCDAEDKDKDEDEDDTA